MCIALLEVHLNLFFLPAQEQDVQSDDFPKGSCCILKQTMITLKQMQLVPIMSLHNYQSK